MIEGGRGDEAVVALESGEGFPGERAHEAVDFAFIITLLLQSGLAVGYNLVEETNATGGVVARYEQPQNIDEPLAMLRSSTTSYFHADGLGSVTSLSNAAGSIANTYTLNYVYCTATHGAVMTVP